MCEVSKVGMRMVQHPRRSARRNGAVVRLRAGRTLVMTTHDAEEAALCGTEIVRI